MREAVDPTDRRKLPLETEQPAMASPLLEFV